MEWRSIRVMRAKITWKRRARSACPTLPACVVCIVARICLRGLGRGIVWCGDGTTRMSARRGNRLGFERELWQKGTTLVAGVDEAGCGPLAGPVVAGAVLFPHSWLETGLYSKLRGLNDSKQLSEEEREKYYALITSHPDIRFGISIVDVEVI